MYVASGGPNVKWEGTDFKWGDGHHWSPRWRRPWPPNWFGDRAIVPPLSPFVTSLRSRIYKANVFKHVLPAFTWQALHSALLSTCCSNNASCKQSLVFTASADQQTEGEQSGDWCAPHTSIWHLNDWVCDFYFGANHDNLVYIQISNFPPSPDCCHNLATKLLQWGCLNWPQLLPESTFTTKCIWVQAIMWTWHVSGLDYI